MMENQIEIYQSLDGIVLNVRLSNETVWLSQDQLSILFERDQSVISRHLANVFKERELKKETAILLFMDFQFIIIDVFGS